MNTERLLREVEARLSDLGEAHRLEVLDALREEIARERRRLDPELTVEAERERRLEAETLREALEAITRPSRLEDAVDEVLKQIGRIVSFDVAAVALFEPDGPLRVVRAQAAPGSPDLVGAALAEPFTAAIRESRSPVSVADAEAEATSAPLPGVPTLRSWAGIPLLVEGEVIGALCLGREALDSFIEEELRGAKALAFSAAAAIRRAQLLDQVHRYAVLLEQVVAVYQRVLAGDPPAEVARAILEGTARVGHYKAGLLVLQSPRGPVVAAAMGDAFAGTEGRPAPPDLAATAARHLDSSRMPEVAEALQTVLPTEQMYLVPLSTPDAHVGTLALLCPDGETPDQRLVESYASRAAAAYRHATECQGRP